MSLHALLTSPDFWYGCVVGVVIYLIGRYLIARCWGVYARR